MSSKILLAGNALSIGYLQKYLLLNKYQSFTLVLDETTPFHHKIINIEQLKTVLSDLKSLPDRRRSQEIIEILKKEEVLTLLTAEQLAIKLNAIMLHRSSTTEDTSVSSRHIERRAEIIRNKSILKWIFSKIWIDYNNNNYYLLRDKINETGATIVGLSIITPNRHEVFSIIEHLAVEFPGITIVLGGIHVTVEYKKILEQYPWLIAVLGEGEEALLALVQALSESKDPGVLSKIPGIAFVKDGAVVSTQVRPLIADLDVLPSPDHSLVLKDKIIGYRLYIITSRGCPFSCAFCCTSIISKQRVRYRSIANVMQELDHITMTYPQVVHVEIMDDNFLVHQRRALEFCDTVIKSQGLGCIMICRILNYLKRKTTGFVRSYIQKNMILKR